MQVQPLQKHRKPEKVITKCVYSKVCGGCQFSNMPYTRQLKLKQKALEKLLGKFGKVQPILGMKDPYHYRNKVHAVFKRERNGTIKAGNYKEGTHEVVEVPDCLLHTPQANQIILTVKKLVKSFKLKVFDEDTHQGFLRHILIRTGHTSHEILVILVTSTYVFPSKKNFVAALKKAHPEITTIVQNINPAHTNMILGEKNHTLLGKGYIEDELCGLTFKISPNSFYQVNPVQTQVLYQKAIELAGLTGKETVIDAYCGIGTIGLSASSKAKKIIGIELNPFAVKDAIYNAKRNHIENAVFYAKDAEKFMVDMAKHQQKADLVLMDPPRSGSTKNFIKAVEMMAPQTVVYISCNPETLRRDLEDFIKLDYKVCEIVPVDMFPLTSHVEAICKLIKNK